MSKPPRIDLRALDIGMLRTFDALMRERSVSRAASRLFLSQPAVSGSLAKLRRTFGDPLFRRTASGVTPTPLALSMAEPVAELITRMGRLLEIGHHFDPTASDRIFRLAGSDYSSRLILSPLMERLRAMNATVRIAWEPPQFHTLFERIRRGDVDLGCAPEPSIAPGLHSAVLFEEHFVLVTRQDHPGFRTGVDALESFCGYPHVFFGFRDPRVESALDQSVSRLGRRCFVQLSMPSFDQAADVIARSDMISVFPARLARLFANRLQTLPLPVHIEGYRSCLYWDRGTEDDPGLRWLRDEILQAARAGTQAIAA
ncbi:MAG: LysR family transcriptional regulator [Hydrogenophaga sp.]|uniref:LysR family transcriptional regulator n=1 Tax=Hydrogenophaga sp. TaxID=1904254 RepID=UPI001DE2813C|nr:LysR family transcriptional regulator [Hydrogenophaga sp.]MBX3608870.1 LysR family transcriptional regulator [Hydrogenophaga sp.]